MGQRTDKVYITIGASNHTPDEREINDYYATDPRAIDLLLEQEEFYPHIWEPACGEGHLSNRLKQLGYLVYSSDLIDRGYGVCQNFLTTQADYVGDIITNPPYKHAMEFVYKGLELLKPQRKMALFLKLTFMEGKKRKDMFMNHPPKVIYVSSSRIICAKNGDFDNIKSSAIAYAWYVWEKGYKGNTTIKWIN